MTNLLLINNHGRAPETYKADSVFKLMAGGHGASASMTENAQGQGLVGSFQIHCSDTKWAFTGQVSDVHKEV